MGYQKAGAVEYPFTAGRIIFQGNVTSRGQKKRVDYLLFYKPNIPLAIIEAKDNNHPSGAGLQQAIDYANTLDIKYVYASNGDEFVEQNLITGEVRDVPLDAFPSPDELYARYKEDMGISECNGLVANTLQKHRWFFNTQIYIRELADYPLSCQKPRLCLKF